jgi:septum formation protein
MGPQFYLASASPRRRQLLEQLGLRFEVVVADVDESLLPGEAAEAYVSRVAEAKARAVVEGKPKDRAHGIAMLSRLAGRSHQVLSAVALWHAGRVRMAVSRSRVTFRTVSAEEAAAYWASGEPADKAGSYGIQGLGGVFVVSLEGSHSGVMGLPLFETATLLKEAGIDVL